ncbi:hypothetical protein M501DRAFT_1012222 [Patellaria atrata CBS 101060]|uniref:Sodium/calcium exchanger membrane region domain-containing protein n=1 Tax=Patellaria atrata CBS 101060 TaxID=1346257 RepID=A0A9P4SHX0_9PEZI|nr:hypothetical protein M501DRAFT_1012222 [Patellaria atrata CBS 101060]
MSPHETPNRRRRYSVRAFYLSILITLGLATIVFIVDKASLGARQSDHGALLRRALDPQRHNHEAAPAIECRLVHDAKDKCAFVRANCPDEEAGIFSYLSLYYCYMPQAQGVAFAIMVMWLGLLFSTIGIAASDFFCVNLSTISNLLGMSESMAGVTFLAFGNGSPDVFSTFAAMSTNSGSLAVGELIGAAGFITAVVAGSMALVRPFNVARKSFIRDVGFFIVAAAFSMVFLYDGKLYLWECCVMVGFYIFYVCFVVFWHWWLGRRRRRRQKEFAVRSQYITPGGEEQEIEPYHDEDDENVNDHPTPSRGVSVDDITTLERGAEDTGPELEDDDEEEFRERWMGELSSNMRLNRPAIGERRLTQVPIRPSLVGALEFRAVLSSLQKSRNIQSMPLHMRRYSDDPAFTTAQQQNVLSSNSDPASRPPYDIQEGSSDISPYVSRPGLDYSSNMGNRARAVSVNDVEGLRYNPDAILTNKTNVPSIDLLGPLPEDNEHSSSPSTRPDDLGRIGRPTSPSLTLTPPVSAHGSRATSPVPPHRRTSRASELLAPPEAVPPGVHQQARQSTHMRQPSQESLEQTKQLPKLDIPSATKKTGSPMSPFPAFLEELASARSSRPPSIRLPPPSASPDSYFPERPLGEDETRPLSWWPYRFLVSPEILCATLFPTLYSWHDKNIWEKFLGVVAAPSVFLLAITLPVVESSGSGGDNSQDRIPDLSLAGSLTPSMAVGEPRTKHSNQPSLITILEPDEPNDREVPRTGSLPNGESFERSYGSAAVGGYGPGTAGTAIRGSMDSSSRHQKQTPSTLFTNSNERVLQSPEQLPTSPPSPTGPRDWNRWLIITQLFTAPFFVILIIWANLDPDSPKLLLRNTAIGLICSLAGLLLLLLTTTPDRPPKWRTMFCFLGFVVSIAWISTIANEVVGVLKTIGVILNISDAILGLTIFAVGNSLGDLVADITVARLGFPVMALSACFGGPMLNILLGIGLSGSYLTIKGARKKHEHHPSRPIKFKPYHIDVSSTLMISGVTLLVTLVGLLVLVPMRKWKMDRVVAGAAIGLWILSTVGNVVVEVVGWGEKWS